MGLRITNAILNQQVLGNLQDNLRRLAELQDRLATGRVLNRPSDDPRGVQQALSLRASLEASEQFIANINFAENFILAAEDAVAFAFDAVLRVRELTIRGINDTLNQENRNILAEEVNILLEEVMDLANTQANNRFIFGGTRTSAPPFVVTATAGGEITGIGYNGDSQNIQIQTLPGITVNINIPGDQVFQSTQDLFQTLIDIREDLQAGTLTDARLAELDNIQTDLLNARSTFGATGNRLDFASNRLQNQVVNDRRLLASVEEADFIETIMNLNSQENAFRAALDAGARVLQPSLLDFLS